MWYAKPIQGYSEPKIDRCAVGDWPQAQHSRKLRQNCLTTFGCTQRVRHLPNPRRTCYNPSACFLQARPLTIHQLSVIRHMPTTSPSTTFQSVIMRLQQFWADYGCVIWQPHNVQVGAGTMNPATFLRVLGPEPWNVAYVEPSIRPDDGRYGDNPNRMQMHHQMQVILKPDPGNPQELYLQSLEAIGLDRRQHDIRFVEDKWESPALGAWGLGWEVWLDGQEITQFTYFQQAGGQNLMPNAVEITYGLERIVLALQGADDVWDMRWTGDLRYGDILLRGEIEQCIYYFELADVNALRAVFSTYEAEANRILAHQPPLVMPAHDYVLKCSHLFNVLDTRGAIGVVERADYFKRMQALAAGAARAYTDQRREMEYPLLPPGWSVDAETGAVMAPAADQPVVTIGEYPAKPAPFLLEIGTEELPVADLDDYLAQLRELVPARLDEARLAYESATVSGTPRRLVVSVEGLAPTQTAAERIERGPAARIAFDGQGRPTKAAEGFARKWGLTPDQLETVEIDGGQYAAAHIREAGRPAHEVLSELLPDLIGSLRTGKAMRWNRSGVAFSRPIRWLVALLGEAVVPFTYAEIYANRITRGTRPMGSPEIELKGAKDHARAMQKQGIVVDREARRAEIEDQIHSLAQEAGGRLLEDTELLDEVTNLVEQPTAVPGHFDEHDLELPDVVLTTVMKKHQRYFAVVDKRGRLLPMFITVRNGDDQHLDSVRHGNEHVIRARFADARFFYNRDIRQPLRNTLPALKLLTFHEKLGSYYEKAARIEGITGALAGVLGLSDEQMDSAIRAARLCKADLTTALVVEMTSLQGVMGEIYARQSGEPEDVAAAIREHYLPRYAGDALPETLGGIAVAVADRLDSLVGLLAVGLAPTGSADPYGLRRAAQGVVQILTGHRIDLDLRPVIERVAKSQPVKVGKDEQAAILDFITGRLRVVLRESYAHDVVEAVLGTQGHNPYRALLHADQLARHVARPDWEPILDAYARCVRITRSQEKQYKLRADAFGEAVEKELLAGYQTALAARGDDPDVDTFMVAFGPLVPAISAFFAPEAEGGVLVMHPEKAIRENRLALLQHIVGLADGVADLSQMEGF